MNPAPTPPPDNYVVAQLKARWFDLARQEQATPTPKITEELDRLTEAIKQMQQPGQTLGS